MPSFERGFFGSLSKGCYPFGAVVRTTQCEEAVGAPQRQHGEVVAFYASFTLALRTREGGEGGTINRGV